MPNEESIILLIGKTAMNKKSYLRQVSRINLDKNICFLPIRCQIKYIVTKLKRFEDLV